MSPYPTSEIEASIERVAWVRGLARALVANEHEAEDLAQDAWLASLRQGPLRQTAWKGWFAGVLRNLVRARFRGDHRRREREREAAAEDRVPAQDELVGQLELHELVVREVRRLDEPYRSTIALRYFEGLTPKQISQRTCVPLRTVETRLRRGLQHMRERLDVRNRGDRSAWVALLLPLARSRDLAVAGTLAVSLKLKIAVAVATVLVLVWVAREPRRSPSAEIGSPLPAADAPVAQLEPRQPIEGPRRQALEPSSNAAKPHEIAGAIEPAPARSILGAVLDSSGAPLAGVPVAFADRNGTPIPGHESITNARGEFELVLAKASAQLDVPGEEWVVVLRPALSLEAGVEHVFVLARPRVLAGDVVDEAGHPLRAAKIELEMPSDLRASIERVLDRCIDQHWRSETLEDGSFHLEAAPDLEGCSLRSTLPGFETCALELAPGDRNDLRIVMKRPEADARRIRGQVVDELGVPVENAYVALAGDPADSGRPLLAVSTDTDGAFEIRLTDADRRARLLRALKAGKMPAEVPCSTDTPWSSGAWPDPLVLVLRGSVLSIEGVVLDVDGRPVPDARIANLDASRFGTVETEWNGTRVESPEDIEALLADHSSSVGSAAYTDEHGHFELKGLLPKSYRLSAFSPAKMQLAVTGPIEAGRQGLEIRFSREERFDHVTGRVVGKSGTAVAGAQVWLVRKTTPPAATSVRAFDTELTGSSIRTDGEGRFEFRDVPRAVVKICARAAPQTPDATVALDASTDLDDVEVEIVVPLECHFKLDLTGSPIQAAHVRVLDAGGRALSIGVHRGDLSMTSDGEFAIDDAISEALTVSEDAAELVLSGAGGELERIPLNLVPGQLVIVRP